MKQHSINIKKLRLDVENPRLPADIGDDLDDILEHVILTGSLDELARSMLDNGFFEAERLIVLEEPKRSDSYVVVEGNRRLATLMVLHDRTGGIPFIDVDEPTDDQLAALTDIPCLEVENRTEVDNYLAYRHIGGMKTWSAEARARFTKKMVDKIASSDAEPFKIVGRQVGSNSQGVRNSYIAISVLEYGRDQLGLDTEYLQYRRFGVWIRAMNSAEIRDYIGLGRPREITQIRETLDNLDGDRLGEVVSDLSSRSDGRPALVGDSRDITAYGRVLADDQALTAFRRFEDLDIAKQIVERRTFVTRVDKAATNVSAIMDHFAEVADRDVALEVRPSAEKLASVSRSFRSIVLGLVDDDD